MLQIFNDGPSFKPIYFIIISEVSSSKALPSISCWRMIIESSLVLNVCSFHQSNQKKSATNVSLKELRVNTESRVDGSQVTHDVIDRPFSRVSGRSFVRCYDGGMTSRHFRSPSSRRSSLQYGPRWLARRRCRSRRRRQRHRCRRHRRYAGHRSFAGAAAAAAATTARRTARRRLVRFSIVRVDVDMNDDHALAWFLGVQRRFQRLGSNS